MSDSYKDVKFDYIVSFLPHNGHPASESSHNRSHPDIDLVIQAFETNLKDDGTCVLLLPGRYLRSPAFALSRKEICQNISLLIDIPVPGLGLQYSLVVLKKGDLDKDVEMVDLFIPTGEELQTYFADLLDNKDTDFPSGTSMMVSRREILESPYNVLCSFEYRTSREVKALMAKGDEYKRISDVLRTFETREFQNDRPLGSFEPVRFSREPHSFRMIYDDGFAPSRLTYLETIYPTLFLKLIINGTYAVGYAIGTVDHPIIYDQHMKQVFAFDDKRYDPDYLVYSIRRALLKLKRRQLFGFSILSLYIPTPPIDEQRRIMAELRSQDEEFRRKELLSRQEIQNLQDLFRLQLKSKRHSLKNALESISQHVDLEYQSIQMDRTEISKESIESLLKDILGLLDGFHKKINLELNSISCFGSPEDIDLNEYFTQYVRKNQNLAVSKHFGFRYIPFSGSFGFGNDDSGEASSRLLVFVNHNDLDNLVDNILTNAIKHGFVEKRIFPYYFEISTSYDQNNGRVVMDFINNGKPMPESIDELTYSTKGFTAGGMNEGEGEGGAYVHDFVKHYQGVFSIHSDVSDNGILTRIRVEIPLNIDGYEA